ncbi:MAG: hypothetical protein JEZ02_16055 [Desulfatibacillum sp.]|nr:hypothetical protein [Desulfatibacillum sp.]
MKQYVIDQLRPNDFESLKNFLDEKHGPALMGGIYWIPVDEELLNPVQAAHTECQPHCFALELDYTTLSAELLVRTLAKVRCQCMGYADKKQREWMMDFVDATLERLGISV